MGLIAPSADCNRRWVASGSTSVAEYIHLVRMRTDNDTGTVHVEAFRVVHYLFVVDNQKNLQFGLHSAVSFRVQMRCHPGDHRVVVRASDSLRLAARPPS